MIIEKMKISQIMLDGGTQAREKLDFQYIADVAEKIVQGNDIEPIILFFDGSKYWLADGFHRARAAVDANQKVIRADVREGDRRAALLFGLMAAANPSSQRTRLDKRRAVTLLISDDEWCLWSNEEIADKLNVSVPFVKSIRKNSLERQTKLMEKETDLVSLQEKSSSRKNLLLPRQENLLVLDALDDENKYREEFPEDDIKIVPSAERCIIIDPYMASAETIANIIEKLKAHYRRKTGKEYNHF